MIRNILAFARHAQRADQASTPDRPVSEPQATAR
jgi:hypothetical protein